MAATASKPKVAKAVVEGVAFICAHCGENLSEPSSGSHLWTTYDAEQHAGERVECSTCGQDNRLPSKIRPRMP